MAFERNKLAKLGGGTGDSNAVYIYSSTEAVGTTGGANYFNDASDELTVGDVIILIDTDFWADNNSPKGKSNCPRQSYANSPSWNNGSRLNNFIGKF